MDFSGKMQIRSDLSKEDALTEFLSKRKTYWSHFIHEYDMDFLPYGEKQILRISLSTEENKQIQEMTKELCRGTNLKPVFTRIGKSAEAGFKNCVNSLFHLFRIKKQIVVNDRKYLYGGDGGGDFFLGTKVFDIKYRNESPSHGMILDHSFIERTPDDVILIHVTNSVSTKLGNLDENLEQNLPLAISGWVTMKEFKEKSESINNGRNSRALDKMNSIDNLLIEILREQIEAEKLFSYE